MAFICCLNMFIRGYCCIKGAEVFSTPWAQIMQNFAGQLTSALQSWQVDMQLMYRVAQNKIPHQTICNISATSGLISKILEAA